MELNTILHHLDFESIWDYPLLTEVLHESFGRCAYGRWCCPDWICYVHASAGVWVFLLLKNGISLNFFGFLMICLISSKWLNWKI
jgi:hypothetical protein